MTSESEDAPLAGLKVLDLSRVLAGPYCTMTLADMGAEVIKVESPKGDDTREWGPPFMGEESVYFLSVNRGKRSLCLDLKQEEGREALSELAAWADVVVENFRPGDAHKLGASYETLKAHNPSLIHVTISGFGQRGDPRFTALPGYDLVLQGMGGIAALTGPADGAPHKVGASIADLVAGTNAVAAILASLWGRQRTGAGRHIDLSLLDGQLSLLTYHASAWLNLGVEAQRHGNAHPSLCPYETFRAQDGWLNVACGNDGQFVRLASALGQPQWATASEFALNASRVENRGALTGLMRDIIVARTVGHWLEVLADARVPAGPILSTQEVLQHPHVDARGLVVEHNHPTLGTLRSVGSPLGMSPASATTLPPPRLGEHTDMLLREVLGWGKQRIVAARKEGFVA